MTIRDSTRPVAFEVTAQLTGDTISGSASTRLRMTDFGFNPPAMTGLFAVEDEFAIIVTFVAREDQ